VADLLESGKVTTVSVTGIETLQTRYGVLQRCGRPLSPAAGKLRALILEFANLQ
jgi:hypothetical protein